jgi:quercetin dioxygenase-like cupin family protein
MAKLANIEAVREYAVDAPKTAELGRRPQLRCFAYFFKAGQRLAPQTSGGDALLFIVRGRARVRIGDREEEGRAGDVFMAAEAEAIAIGNTGRDELIVLAAIASGEKHALAPSPR